MNIREGYLARVGIDAPTVAGSAIDTVGITKKVVDVQHQDRIVGIDIDVIGVVGRGGEDITVNIGNIADTALALLLEVNLSGSGRLGMNGERIEDRRVGGGNTRSTPTKGKPEMVLTALGANGE